MANFNFKLLSLNARGIRDFNKRETIFTWIKKQKVDIAFLQETYSSQEIENDLSCNGEAKCCLRTAEITVKAFSFFSVKTFKLISGTCWRIVRADISLWKHSFKMHPSRKFICTDKKSRTRCFL